MAKTTHIPPAPQPQVALFGPVQELAEMLLPVLLAAMPSQEEKFLRPQEVTDEFGIAVGIVRRLIKENQIPHTGKVFGDNLVPRSLFIEYVRKLSLSNVAEG